MVTAETYPCTNADAMVCSCKSQFLDKENFGSSHCEISISCTSQKYDNVTTPNYPFFTPLSVKWSLTGGKNKKNFKLLVLKVVVVAYERSSLTRGSHYSHLTWKLLVLRKTGR